jgi:hypothetical protein
MRHCAVTRVGRLPRARTWTQARSTACAAAIASPAIGSTATTANASPRAAIGSSRVHTANATTTSAALPRPCLEAKKTASWRPGERGGSSASWRALQCMHTGSRTL